jgi:hypothetical protein
VQQQHCARIRRACGLLLSWLQVGNRSFLEDAVAKSTNEHVVSAWAEVCGVHYE